MHEICAQGGGWQNICYLSGSICTEKKLGHFGAMIRLCHRPLCQVILCSLVKSHQICFNIFELQEITCLYER